MSKVCCLVKNKAVIFTWLVLIMFKVNLFAETIGTNGATYPIAEPDAYEELMAKVRSTNWNKIIKDYKADVNKVIKVSFSLGRAREDRLFYIDPAYTLQFDIMDENGRIIYPKGYSFNPLDYISFPYYLVFFDGTSVAEIVWLKKQEWFKNWNVIFILTKGDVVRAEKQLGRTVFAAMPQMIEKFKISKTPSILSAQNKQLVISEVGIYGEKKK